MSHNDVKMRTTINIPDHLLIAAKQLAAAQKTSLARIMEESLRSYMAEERKRSSAPRHGAELPVVTSAQPRPDIDLTRTSELIDIP
jgi:metal-responsive CopG/Arc/MetJ family transcriptional regulator